MTYHPQLSLIENDIIYIKCWYVVATYHRYAYAAAPLAAPIGNRTRVLRQNVQPPLPLDHHAQFCFASHSNRTFVVR